MNATTYDKYYTKNYSFEELMSDFNYCYKQLVAIYPEIQRNNYTLIFNYTAFNRFGYCCKKRQGVYEIQINYHFTRVCDKDKIRNTIMHELIHTLDDCMCHTGRWHVVCNRINYEYGYDLSRTNSYNDYTQFRNKVKPRTRMTKKYNVSCNRCGEEWAYSKQGKIVKELQINPQSTRFTCPYCNNKHFSLFYI